MVFYWTQRTLSFGMGESILKMSKVYSKSRPSKRNFLSILPIEGMKVLAVKADAYHKLIKIW